MVGNFEHPFLMVKNSYHKPNVVGNFSKRVKNFVENYEQLFSWSKFFCRKFEILYPFCVCIYIHAGVQQHKLVINYYKVCSAQLLSFLIILLSYSFIFLNYFILTCSIFNYIYTSSSHRSYLIYKFDTNSI